MKFTFESSAGPQQSPMKSSSNSAQSTVFSSVVPSGISRFGSFSFHSTHNPKNHTPDKPKSPQKLARKQSCPSRFIAKVKNADGAIIAEYEVKNGHAFFQGATKENI